MAHTNITSKVCKLGHNIIASMIDARQEAGESARVTRDEVASALNDKLGLTPVDRAYWDEGDVRTALRWGAFDTDTRMFHDMPGRYGGIRDVDVDEQKKLDAEARKKFDQNEKRKAARKAKKTKAPATPKPEPTVQPEPQVEPQAAE